MQNQVDSWHKVANVREVPSPALLVYPERVEENIRRMLQIASGPTRLRPHVKTHKLSEIVRMQMAHGISKFECATIAEMEMTASCGAQDVLLAYQPVGPNVGRLVQLAKAFPNVKFSAIADDPQILQALSAAAVQGGVQLEILLDIDCGMHRSGVEPGAKALEIYRLLTSLPSLKPAGLHAYDGHIHDRDLPARVEACKKAFAPVETLRKQLISAGLPVPTVVAGGTPTFPIHAADTGVECSPGTCLLWDAGYTAKLPDMMFLPAPLLLTRVVSKP